MKREKLQEMGHRRTENVEFQQLRQNQFLAITSEGAIAVHRVASHKNVQVQYLQGTGSGFFKLLLSPECRNTLLKD